MKNVKDIAIIVLAALCLVVAASLVYQKEVNQIISELQQPILEGKIAHKNWLQEKNQHLAEMLNDLDNQLKEGE